MNIPARLIRAVVQDIPGLRPELNPRAQRTREHILTAAVKTFAALGRRGITMRALGEAIWISRDRIRVHFLDIDSLLAEILQIHLQGIARALGNAANTPRDRRAAYYAYTRGYCGSLTREHALFVFEREHLPPDLLPDIEHVHSVLGPILCPENPARALAWLDQPICDLEEIELLLARKSATTQPQPEQHVAAAAQTEPDARSLQAQPCDVEPPEAEPETPPPAPIRHLTRPFFSRPPKPRSMASLLRPFDDPPPPFPIAQSARASPSTA